MSVVSYIKMGFDSQICNLSSNLILCLFTVVTEISLSNQNTAMIHAADLFVFLVLTIMVLIKTTLQSNVKLILRTSEAHYLVNVHHQMFVHTQVNVLSSQYFLILERTACPQTTYRHDTLTKHTF
jgi:hypothetical protein